MKNWFKLTNIKRLIILGFTLVTSILAIILGSVFYLGKPGEIKLSPEYGGSVQYLVTIKPPRGKKASDMAEGIAESIKNRLDPLGQKGIKSEAEIYGDEASIRVTYPAVDTEEERNEIEQKIIHKPKLLLTDFYGNPLFTKNGSFNPALVGDPGKYVPFNNHQTLKDLLYRDPSEINEPVDSLVPIADEGAKAVLNQGKSIVQIQLASNDAATQWANATKYLSQLPKGKNKVMAWLDPQEAYTRIYDFFNRAETDRSVLNSANDLNSFIRVDQKPDGILRKNTVPVEEYLISQASVSKVLYGTTFIIEGSFSQSEAQSLARKINYGISNYSLTSNLVLNQQTATYGRNAFQMALIAGIVVFSLIAIVLMVNYGLLGALSTISVALFVFLTLLMFTAMGGEYSPASIAALVIGIGMSVDAVIVTYERLKSELYRGSSISKAEKISFKKSFTTIFDSNITTLIVAIVLFYFGTSSIIGLSVTLIFSLLFTMLIMVLLNRFAATLLLRSNFIKNHKLLIGLRPKLDAKIQSKIENYDYMKNTKWFSMFSFVIMLGGLVVFIIFASLGGSFGSGLNLSQEFTGGISISAKGSAQDLINVKNDLIDNWNFASSDIKISGTELTARSSMQIKDLESIRNSISSILGTDSYSVFNTTTAVAEKMVRNALLSVGIAMGFIVVYTIIRFKWTYSIAALIALVHDALIVIFFFAMIRTSIEPVFVAAILTTIGYSINDTIVTFDRVREKMSTHIGAKNKEDITKVANAAVKDTLKRSLLTSLTTMVAIIVLMSFGNATKMEYNIAMLIGLVSGTYSSIFIATWSWVRLETYRQKRINARDKNGFWKVDGLEEQTIKGINDFVA